jgi:RNA polymerase sigma-B factor
VAATQTIHPPDPPPDDRDRADMDRRLFERYGDAQDPVDRAAIVERFLPLARQLAARYQRPEEPFDDVFQVACFGLIKAVDRFDVDRKIEFSTYATPNILGEIKRYFRDKGWAMRVPRGLQELRQSAKEVIRDETVRTGRSPSIQELADALDADVEGVAEALTLGRAYNTASLDAPVSQDEPEGDTIIDLQADDGSQIEGLEDRLLLQEAIDSLKGQQQQILRLRFNEGKTQTEIADHIGVSQMHVSRLLRRAIEDLRVELEHLEEEREETPLTPDGAHAE